MRFRVRTSFGVVQERKRSFHWSEYVLTLVYRSLLPLVAWTGILVFESPWWVEAFLWLVLCFFVFVQFSWRVER